MKPVHTLILASVFAFCGCATSLNVELAKANPTRAVAVVAQVPDAGNSPEMNNYLESALRKEGLAVKVPLAAGTRTASDLDAIVSYGDNWRWDLVMYLRSLSVRMYDAQTGDLLVIGEWKNSAFHGFQDAKVVMQELVSAMLIKLRSATKP